MLSVYKYIVPVADYFELDLPIGARILKIEGQHNEICLWALVEPGAITKTRKFRFAGTGHPIYYAPVQLEHISTFQLDGGNLVFHIFEIIDGKLKKDS